ncbi:hypothetical protein MRQ36_27905 [Micromonospora sp. R77]|uniref:hypothetical protein n=1 Tax=Micromonospora sp. R77 TaxID=2925836 RepID=UPI001F602138|nr:hypothetical protein [Micromonospora sp. R77]MCI4066166.1 hypothetical protein [Micromonospora sp. R77]
MGLGGGHRQCSEVPNGIADRCLGYAAAVMPDRLRGVMYDAPVVGANGVPPTERLARLLGHKRTANE